LICFKACKVTIQKDVHIIKTKLVQSYLATDLVKESAQYKERMGWFQEFEGSYAGHIFATLFHVALLHAKVVSILSGAY